VEQLSRALDFKLDWHRKNKGYIFGGKALYSTTIAEEADEEDVDPDVATENVGEENDDYDDNENGVAHQGRRKKKKSTYLASSFNGSPRHLKTLAHNALTIVTELGQPDVFITGTTNPLWSEIQERLFPGQSAYDRPDVVSEVFHARLEALLHNLRSGKYFSNRKIVYDIRVIEYQHRGLPHFHYCLQVRRNARSW
jgi:hypothetical protein